MTVKASKFTTAVGYEDSALYRDLRGLVRLYLLFDSRLIFRSGGDLQDGGGGALVDI